ncbi:hypothetical protein M951_chr1111 (nucleomorph) [Lotharella oceanica]|uniref:Uncharacterized protein n=1 Tax=Lotharella oceanica TaxID=641309 RepID=A0A060DA46_9EUKA|nr:hypothetical protein M951_chr1111 [Lotharella oceanica]
MLKTIKSNICFLMLKKKSYHFYMEKKIKYKLLKIFYCKILKKKNKFYFSLSFKKIKYLNCVCLNINTYFFLNLLVIWIIIVVRKNMLCRKKNEKNISSLL